MECANRRLLAGVFGELAADRGIYPEYRNDGRRRCKKFKACKRDRLHFVLPDADLFGCDTSVRGHARSYAKSGQRLSAGAGDQADEVGFSRRADPKRMASCHRYGNGYGDLHRACGSIL